MKKSQNEKDKVDSAKVGSVPLPDETGCRVTSDAPITELNWTELIYLVKRTQDVQGKKKCH